MRLDRYVGVYTYVVLAAEIGVSLFLLYFIVRELRKWLKTRTRYFKVRFCFKQRHNTSIFWNLKNIL